MWATGYQEGWVWGSDLGGVVVYLVGSDAKRVVFKDG